MRYLEDHPTVKLLVSRCRSWHFKLTWGVASHFVNGVYPLFFLWLKISHWIIYIYIYIYGIFYGGFLKWGIPNRSIVVSMLNSFPGRPRGSCGPSCGELGRLTAPCAVAERCRYCKYGESSRNYSRDIYIMGYQGLTLDSRITSTVGCKWHQN